MLHAVITDPQGNISLTDWLQATKDRPNFHITGQLKQQNPFTHEYLFMDSPGCGYWQCPAGDAPSWSQDNVVWFRYAPSGITFIQYDKLDNPELVEIAWALHARLVHHGRAA